ncbi:MAG: transposase [Saprospiraceae bacterium]
MECHFGHIIKGKMILNDFGKFALKEWLALSKRFDHIQLDTFQIMPNHMHAIVIIKALPPGQSVEENYSSYFKTLSDVVGAYKSIVSNLCLKLHKNKYDSKGHVPYLGKIWKRSFHDHMIRDQPAHKSISRYIRNNPKNWIHRKRLLN